MSRGVYDLSVVYIRNREFKPETVSVVGKQLSRNRIKMSSTVSNNAVVVGVFHLRTANKRTCETRRPAVRETVGWKKKINNDAGFVRGVVRSSDV